MILIPVHAFVWLCFEKNYKNNILPFRFLEQNALITFLSHNDILPHIKSLDFDKFVGIAFIHLSIVYIHTFDICTHAHKQTHTHTHTHTHLTHTFISGIFK